MCLTSIHVALFSIFALLAFCDAKHIWNRKGTLEKQCLKCACMGEAVSNNHRQNILNILSRKVYVNFASRSDFAWSYLLLMGREPRTNAEVDSLCYASVLNIESSISFTLGSGGLNASHIFNFKKASHISFYNIQQKYDPSEMSEKQSSVYVQSTYPQKLSIAWTDGASYVLGTSCHWDGRTSWYLFSNNKNLPKNMKKFITLKITELGFDASKVYAPNMSTCEN